VGCAPFEELGRATSKKRGHQHSEHESVHCHSPSGLRRTVIASGLSPGM
jgi:hypothetical protein